MFTKALHPIWLSFSCFTKKNIGKLAKNKTKLLKRSHAFLSCGVFFSLCKFWTILCLLENMFAVVTITNVENSCHTTTRYCFTPHTSQKASYVACRMHDLTLAPKLLLDLIECDHLMVSHHNITYHFLFLKRKIEVKKARCNKKKSK